MKAETPTLTHDEIRKFAEAGGWIHAANCPHATIDDEWHCIWFRPDGFLVAFPDFANDLNACVEILDAFARRGTEKHGTLGWDLTYTDDFDLGENAPMGYHCTLYPLKDVRTVNSGDNVLPSMQAAIIKAVLAAAA